MAKIQVLHDVKANLPTLDVGEFGFATDTGELFIGSSIGNLEFARRNILGMRSELTTDDKSSLVNAINEVNQNKGSTVSDSTTNGTIVVDGVEIVVYDPSGKANVVHDHTLEDLTDVDVTTVVPSEGDFLIYSGGVWLPGDGSFGTDGVIPEDFTGEEVELNNPITPIDVETITAIKIEKTSLTLNWSPSPSTNTISYNVYQGLTLLGNVPYLQREFEVTGLSPYTNYDFKVTSIDEYGNESNGTNETIQSGSYALVMNGFPQVYLTIPSLTITEFVMEFKLTKSNNKQFLIDGRLPMSLSEISSTGDVENYGAYFDRVYVDDVQVKNNTKWFGSETVTTLKWVKNPNTAVGATLQIFSAYHKGDRAVGELYDIKAYNQGVLLAHYDFRTGTFDDQTGNNNTLLHTAGRFI